MAKSIKNYTSSVPADKSIMAIEQALIGMGAKKISKDYEEGKVKAIQFAIERPDGFMTAFMLPARVDAIKKLFLQSYRRPTASQTRECEAQATRTAWKNMQLWVELQATMIKLDQIEFMEAFMPYIYNLNEKKTFYNLLKDDGFKKLPA